MPRVLPILTGVLFLCVADATASNPRAVIDPPDDQKAESREHPTAYEAAEEAIRQARLADSERILHSALTENPRDDRARFTLGIVQCLRAIENLGKALYEYGAVSENATAPFLRLPVPRNPSPTAITYRALGRVLDVFAHELGRAEATLSKISDDHVKAPLRLAEIHFSFGSRKDENTSLLEILQRLNGRELPFSEKNPDFLVHFDRGDVAWLRAYCHLLSGMIEAYRSADEERGFEQRVSRIFPRIEAPSVASGEDWYQYISIVDPPRLRRMRLHFIAVCQLNRETWRHIRKETDDEFEWLPHPKQTDQLGLPITDAQIDTWLSMMAEIEGMLTGKRLVPSSLLQIAFAKHPSGQGLNVAKMLDNPPADLFNLNRLRTEGINPSYLESEKSKPLFEFATIWRVTSVFNGPLGFFYAARMN